MSKFILLSVVPACKPPAAHRIQPEILWARAQEPSLVSSLALILLTDVFIEHNDLLSSTCLFELPKARALGRQAGGE